MRPRLRVFLVSWEKFCHVYVRRENNLHTLFLAAFTHEFHDQFDTFSSFPLSSDDLGEVLLQQNMLSLRKIKPHCNDETKHAN